MFGQTGKIVDVKKTLEALFIKVFRGVYQCLGQGKKLRLAVKEGFEPSIRY